MATKTKRKIAYKKDKKPEKPSVEMTKEDQEDDEGRKRVRSGKLKFSQAREVRRKHDWEWLVRTLYVRGYHYARYSRGANVVTFATRTGVRIPINLVWAHMRAVRNQITSFRPKWEVLPAVTTETAIDNARYSVSALDYLYKKLRIKMKIKEVITHGLLYSIGIWQFGIKDKDKIFINTIDPFDFYVDPKCQSSDINDEEYGAQYVIKVVSHPIEAIKNNKLYKNTENLTSDNEVTSAEYKRFLLQITKHHFRQEQSESPTKLLYEVWQREYQDNGKFKIRILTYCDDVELPLRDELTDETDYPFEIFQGEVTPLSLYGEAWIKHIIPINRVIDALESHVFEYNHFFAKGRFIIDKNSGVRIIVNQHGQIIEKNRGSQVSSMDISPLPEAPFTQIQNFRRYLEDLSGAHDVSLGRIPTGIRSGKGIAELRQADATNQDDLVDNLESFLERSGARILRLIAENWTTSKLISVTGIGGKPDYFMAVGEGADRLNKKKEYTFGTMKLPLAVIGKENEVHVRVGSWLAYTKAARKEELKELYKLGAIDQKALLEHLEFGDIKGILDRTRTERLLEQRAASPSASVMRLSGNELSDEELALSENELMLEGKDQPVEPDDDHEVHVSIHREIQDDKTHGDLIRAHINEHASMARWLNTNAAQGAPPVEEGGPPTSAPPGGAPPTMGGL